MTLLYVDTLMRIFFNHERTNYIHLMCEFLSVPELESLSIVYKNAFGKFHVFKRHVCEEIYENFDLTNDHIQWNITTESGTQDQRVDNCSFECEKKHILGVETMKT